MIDRALGFTPTQSYYFQLYPVNLILLQQPVPTPQSKYKFSIYKGLQKFDENKIVTQANFINTNGAYVMPFRGCQLNFYLPNFNVNRKTLFTLKLTERDATQEYQLGHIDIDPSNYITEFKENGTNRFEIKYDLSEQFSLQFEIYVQKSRFALEKIVKSFKTQRSMKSPVRQRKSPERRTPNEDARSPLADRRSPTRQTETETVQSSQKIQSSSSRYRARGPQQTPKPQQFSREPEQQEQPQQKSRSVKSQSRNQNNLRAPLAQRQKSQKSETIISPMVKTKQMKRTSGRNETTIRASQRLVHENQEPVVTPLTSKQGEDSWRNHLQLIVFTLVGIFMIYWVMHPTRRV